MDKHHQKEGVMSPHAPSMATISSSFVRGFCNTVDFAVENYSQGLKTQGIKLRCDPLKQRHDMFLSILLIPIVLEHFLDHFQLVDYELKLVLDLLKP